MGYKKRMDGGKAEKIANQLIKIANQLKSEAGSSSSSSSKQEKVAVKKASPKKDETQRMGVDNSKKSPFKQ
jgi:hypothetical protein